MNQEKAFSNLLLDQNFQKLNDLLRKLTVFDILKIENKELPFTRLLTWLLDPQADHQMGARPLKLFMRECLAGAPDDQTLMNAAQLELLNLSDVALYSEYQVEATLSNSSGTVTRREGRLDVYGEYYNRENNKQYPLLLIEAKIESSQHNDQTQLYQQWSRNQVDNKAPIRPLLIYLAPDVEIDETIANDFIAMNFTQLNTWLETLKLLPMSTQANFLINELYALNAKTSRAQSDEVELLVEEIRSAHEKDINVLKTNLQISPLLIDEYEPALASLNLMAVRRGSHGYDQHLAIVRQAANDLFSENQKWSITGGEGSVTLRYLPLQEKLSQLVGVNNGINLDCWMDRSKNHLEIAFYSIKPKLPTDFDEKDFRRSLIQKFRNLFTDLASDTFIVRTGSNFQVAHISLPRETTTLETAKANLALLAQMSILIDKWIETGIEGL